MNDHGRAVAHRRGRLVARKLFQKIDRDNSGILEFNELERWCPEAGIYLTGPS